MKKLTIRLLPDDEAGLDSISDFAGTSTLSGTIRKAIKLATEYIGVKQGIADIFSTEMKVNQAKLKKLNQKYGFFQQRLDF